MNNNVYKGDIQPNHKEYSVWVDSKGVIKTFNGNEWIEQSGTSNNGGNSGGGLLLHFYLLRISQEIIYKDVQNKIV